MLKSSGRRIDLSQPFVDAMLPQGHRLHVVLEGISREFAAVNIRKFVLKAARLNDLVRLGSMPPQAARFLEATVLAGQNNVVAGGTQTGSNRARLPPVAILGCFATSLEEIVVPVVALTNGLDNGVLQAGSPQSARARCAR